MKFIRSQHEIYSTTALENFILGFQLGVRMMAEHMENHDGGIRKCKDDRREGRCTAGHAPETDSAIYKNMLAKNPEGVQRKTGGGPYKPPVGTGPLDGPLVRIFDICYKNPENKKCGSTERTSPVLPQIFLVWVLFASN